MSGSPDLLFDELVFEIQAAIDNHPRSQQKRIGPSEVGMPCSRRLGHKIAGTEPPDRGDKWRASVGTAVHTWLEAALHATNQRWIAESGSPRFLLEGRVASGHIGGVEITGSSDVFDTVTSTVVDWKTAGPTQLKHHKRHGADQQQRVQTNLYGRGWAAAGYQVDQVMLVWLPRNGTLKDAFHYAEPYDEQVALDALARANRIDAAVKVLGDEAYTITNEELLGRGLHMLADPDSVDGLALPLDFTSCRFCPLLNNGCQGDVAATAAKTAKHFEGLVA